MRRVSKLVLSALVALSVALGVAPATALANSYKDCPDGDKCTQHEAAIDTTHYDTIEGAITAANQTSGSDTITVTLLKDATMTGGRYDKYYYTTKDITKNITLDLGGHTLKYNENGGFLVNPGCHFTVQNGTYINTNTDQWAQAITGSHYNSTKAGATITVASDAVIQAVIGVCADGYTTLNVNGTIESTKDGVYVAGPKNNVTLDGAHIEAGVYGVYQQDNGGGSSYDIKNSTITTPDTKGSCAIFISNTKDSAEDSAEGMQTLIIENSNISGQDGIEVRYTNVTISGENTQVTAAADGYALGVTHNGNESAVGNLSISGGTFKGVIGSMEGVKNTATLNITGGSFLKSDGGVNAEVKDYIQPGMTQDSNGNIVIDTENAVAKIGNVGYESLQAAVDAVTTTDPATITLLKSTTGSGVVVNGEVARDLTFDLGGFTYTVTSGVGSANTETNGFQLIKDNDITFKNGTIAADPEVGQQVKILIQNYSNLTLENVTLDGTGMTDYNDLNYTLSNNNGEITLNAGTTIIPRASDEIAMDVCWAASYEDGARVTVNEGATIQGNVELGLWNQDAYEGNQSVLTVNGGSITGNLTIGKQTNSDDELQSVINSLKPNVTINGGSFGASVEKYIDDTDSAVAQVQSGNTYSYYTTMDAALEAAQPGDSVTAVNQQVGTTYYTLTLAYNDDNDTPTNATYTVASGTKVPLPKPTRSGYKFQGWYDENGSKVEGTNYEVTSNATLTARWSLIPAPAPTTYDVTVAEAENGEVAVDKAAASAGDTVTVTATPAEGHGVASVSVTCGEKQVDVTDNADGTYAFVMPAGDVTVTVTFEASAPAVELPFTDVAEDDWYYGPVAFVYARGLMTGYEGTTLFGPEDALGREQAAAVLWRALGAGEHAGDCGLADVVQSDWYAQAVNWAVETGLIAGYGDGSGLFGVGDALTRDQFAAIVARVAKADLSKADPSALGAFSDGGEVAGWAVPAVSWAVQVGILEGSPDGEGGMELRPNVEITRGEMATMIMRAAEAGLLPTA